MESHTQTLTQFGQDDKGEIHPAWVMPVLGKKGDKRAMEKKPIRIWREKRGLSRAKLAERMGTSEGQIVKLEAGERRLTTDWLERFSRALDVPVVELVDGGAATQEQITRRSSEASDLMDWRVLREIIITRLAASMHPSPLDEADLIYRLYQDRLRALHRAK